jgi:hypothetical protein
LFFEDLNFVREKYKKQKLKKKIKQKKAILTPENYCVKV